MINSERSSKLAYSQHFCPQNKENIPLRVNYDRRKDKKFVYSREHELPMSKIIKELPSLSKDEQIQRLKRELMQERQRVKYLESTIIEEQSSVLEQLGLLEHKFQQVTSQKRHLELEMQKLKNSQTRAFSAEQPNQWKVKYQSLEQEHKKLKNIAHSMVSMMKKVDGEEGGVHEAWKWVKKVVWEYESIRQKALTWKIVYDQVTQAVQLYNSPDRSD